MAMYESLCASLPHDHDKSTRWRWKEYSSHRLQMENEELRRSLDAQTKRLDDMLEKWTSNHIKYGWSHPPKEDE
jgi:hypothetical protein